MVFSIFSKNFSKIVYIIFIYLFFYFSASASADWSIGSGSFVRSVIPSGGYHIIDMQVNDNTLYILTSTNYIRQYTVVPGLSSSPTYVGQLNLASIASGGTLGGIYINDTRTSLYINKYGGGVSTLYQYSISPTNILSSYLLRSVDISVSGEFGASDIYINNNYIYISTLMNTGTHVIYTQYSITGGNIATIVYVGSYDYIYSSGWGNILYRIYISRNNQYILSSTSSSSTGAVHQYVMSSNNIATMTDTGQYLVVSGTIAGPIRMDGAYLYYVTPGGSDNTIRVYTASSWSENPPEPSKCWQANQASNYEYNSYSVRQKTESDRIQYAYNSYNSTTGNTSVGYSNSGTLDMYAIYNADSLSGSTTSGWFSSGSYITFDSFNFFTNPFNGSPYINISTNKKIDYITIYGSGYTGGIQLSVFSSEGVNYINSGLNIALGAGRDFPRNSPIDLKQYTNQDIYGVIIHFEQFEHLYDVSSITHTIDGIDFGTYTTAYQYYTFCQYEDGSITRDGIIYTGSLDPDGGLPPLPSVSTSFADISGSGNIEGTGGLINQTQLGINTFFDWVFQLQSGANNLIELIKRIFEIGTTTETRSLGSYLFNSAYAELNITNILEDKGISRMEANNDPISQLTRFGIRGILCILFIIAIFLVLL